MKINILLSLILLIMSCSDNLDINQKKFGSLTLNFSTSFNRTLMPSGGTQVTSYDIRGIGPDGAQFFYSNITTNNLIIYNVVPGAWALIVYGKNSDDLKLVSGSTAVLVSSGAVTEANIFAKLLNTSGSLMIVLNWDQQLTSPIVDATLTPAGGSPTPISFTYGYKSAAYANAQLTPGYYTLIITLKDGTELIWGAADVVVILPTQITKGSYYSTEKTSSSSSGPVNIFFTENNTNYIPVFTEKWPDFNVPETIRTFEWSGGSSTFNYGTLTNTNLAFEGQYVWELEYVNNGGWWGRARGITLHSNTYDLKKINMTTYWNWNMSFRIKGSPVSSTNVVVGIQSGIFENGDSIKKMWTLGELGFIGSGDWEKLNINFSSAVNIDWSSMTFVFVMEHNLNAVGSDTILIDDVYWWIDSANHGLPNTNTLPNDIANQVNTNVDPSYQITYQQTKFVPADGKVLYIVGQDKINIPRYYDTIGISGGLASYISIATNDGITNDHFNTGDDIQNVDWLVQNYPNTIAQVAMWMVGVAKYGVDFAGNTTNGQYDYVIDTFSEWAKSVNIPIFLRIGYEFDGAHNMLDPTEYKNAYRYIADRIRLINNVNNVAFVWHSYAAEPYNGHALVEWYPGDDYVDWFGVSIFSGQFINNVPVVFLDNVINMAKDYQKPVMIAESTPQGGIYPDDYRTWNSWFIPVFNYIYEKNIKAFSYINADWGQLGSPSWGNTKIQDFPNIKTQWLNEINKLRYLKQSPTLFSELGF